MEGLDLAETNINLLTIVVTYSASNVICQMCANQSGSNNSVNSSLI